MSLESPHPNSSAVWQAVVVVVVVVYVVYVAASLVAHARNWAVGLLKKWPDSQPEQQPSESKKPIKH